MINISNANFEGELLVRLMVENKFLQIPAQEYKAFLQDHNSIGKDFNNFLPEFTLKSGE